MVLTKSGKNLRNHFRARTVCLLPFCNFLTPNDRSSHGRDGWYLALHQGFIFSIWRFAICRTPSIKKSYQVLQVMFKLDVLFHFWFCSLFNILFCVFCILYVFRVFTFLQLGIIKKPCKFGPKLVNFTKPCKFGPKLVRFRKLAGFRNHTSLGPNLQGFETLQV